MIIHNIEEFAAEIFGTTPNDLERSVYKYTDCGAWIEWDEKEIRIGSIVENSDAVFSCDPLIFPFDTQEYYDAIEWLEQETSIEWNRCNYGDEELRKMIDLVYAYEEKPTPPYTLEDAELELSEYIKSGTFDELLDLTKCDGEMYMDAINYLIENVWH